MLLQRVFDTFSEMFNSISLCQIMLITEFQFISKY